MKVAYETAEGQFLVPGQMIKFGFEYRISSNFSSGQDSQKQRQIGSKLVSYLKLTNN